MEQQETYPPLISVIIPNHNCESYIGRAIDSIIGQTVGNLELLICDDGSDDNSVAVIKEWQKIDGRIKLLVNERNEGHIYTYNRLFGEAAGDYIMIQDADDWSDISRIEKQLTALRETKAQLCLCNSVFHSEKHPNSYQEKVGSFFIDIATKETWAPATLFFQRLVLKEIPGFSSYFQRGTSMDRYFIMELLTHFKGYYLDEHLYHVLVRPNSDHRSINLSEPSYLRKLIMQDIYLTLKQQRIATGTDALAKGDLQSLNELEARLLADKRYVSEKLRVFASIQIDHNQKRRAIKVLFKAIAIAPLAFNNYRTLFYLIRKW